MCGIIGAVAERDVTAILLEGLKRLEYRGYDSAGMVLVTREAKLDRVRAVGKVSELALALDSHPLGGSTGIAHTRWATHGKPSEANAHPHICNGTVAVVHNGIIENHRALHEQQVKAGYKFTSETDTEVIAHQIHSHIKQGKDLRLAVQSAVAELEGAYALGVVSNQCPDRIIAARRGSPLVIGVGIGEHFIASDTSALLPVTQKYMVLEDGDLAEITKNSVTIYNEAGEVVDRPLKECELSAEAVERGPYRHFMLKEIYEQSQAVAETLEGRISNSRLLEQCFGPNAGSIFAAIDAVQIIACGTSYHAGMVARYWIESMVGIPCNVEIASEFRYRKSVVWKNSLVVAISQSGETADTLAAMREAKRRGFGSTLAICNVPESSLVRESDLVLMTRAGPEIGVASTKAFTTQLVALLLLVLAVGRGRGISEQAEQQVVQQLETLPAKMEMALALNDQIKNLAEHFVEKRHALFLGRGAQYPIAMEGALKLKEISYIHAEAYAAGELKHGPLALVDIDMPVVAVAPNNELLEKLKSNLEEVQARGGELFVFADQAANLESSPHVHVLDVPAIDDAIAPIIYAIPLQLLAYHVAVLKGTDIDQPRNLAKSVTVE